MSIFSLKIKYIYQDFILTKLNTKTKKKQIPKTHFRFDKFDKPDKVSQCLATIVDVHTTTLRASQRTSVKNMERLTRRDGQLQCVHWRRRRVSRDERAVELLPWTCSN